MRGISGGGSGHGGEIFARWPWKVSDFAPMKRLLALQTSGAAGLHRSGNRGPEIARHVETARSLPKTGTQSRGRKNILVGGASRQGPLPYPSVLRMIHTPASHHVVLWWRQQLEPQIRNFKETASGLETADTE